LSHFLREDNKKLVGERDSLIGTAMLIARRYELERKERLIQNYYTRYYSKVDIFFFSFIRQSAGETRVPLFSYIVVPEDNVRTPVDSLRLLEILFLSYYTFRCDAYRLLGKHIHT
jgi:hypothetical protein